MFGWGFLVGGVAVGAGVWAYYRYLSNVQKLGRELLARAGTLENAWKHIGQLVHHA